MSRHADEATVRRWFDAFNSRDLEAMLACMDAHVDFRPLRLARDRGRLPLPHRRARLVRGSGADGAPPPDRALESAGLQRRQGDRRRHPLRGGAPPASSSFWAVDQFQNGLIVAARHFLSDRFHLR